LSIPVYTIFKNLTIILIAYGEVIWFGGKVTRLTLASFGLMVFSSIIAAYGDISRHMAMSVLSMPHSSDSLAGGSVDPVTHAMKPAYDVLGAEKAKIAAAYDAGQGDAVLDGMGSIINSGYVWMFLNCLCSAAFVLGMRGRMKSANIKEWETCLLNNILSIPVLLVMSFVSPYSSARTIALIRILLRVQLVEDWSQANFARNL
jgi:GDP-mannose transporter